MPAGSASPSASACLATAVATASETCLILPSGGSRLARGSCLRGRQIGERARRGEKHAVGDAARLHRNGAEADAGIDVGVVGLIDPERRGRRARPAETGCRCRRWRGLASRPADPPASPRCARSDWRAGRSPAARHWPPSSRTIGSENACGLSGGADQHRRPRVGDHVDEVDPARRSQLPTGEPVAALGERRLKRSAAPPCRRPASRRGRPDRSGRAPPFRARRPRSWRATGAR